VAQRISSNRQDVKWLSPKQGSNLRPGLDRAALSGMLLTSMIRSIKKKIKTYLDNYLRDNLAKYHRQHEDSLENWFYYWLWFQNMSYAKDYSPKNTYYEFGTGWGGTLSEFLKAVTRFGKDHNIDIQEFRIFLFDSFEGLPPVARREDDHPAWNKGEFAYSKEYIEDIVKAHHFPLENVRFIEGYFDQTLNAETLASIKDYPPSIITMDVDYYSSTIEALNFLAPILRSGTVLYFDDLYSFFLHPDLGQVKAISEFNNSGIGYLNPLTYRNHEGKCHLFVRREWEYFRELPKDQTV